MQHNIRRNKIIFDLLSQQKKRLDWNISINDMFNRYIFENLNISDSREILSKISGDIQPSILDNDSVLLETLKLIGLMESCVTKVELLFLLERRKEIKYGKPLTEFDKILKAIMTVSNVK